jgi:hypothetical protein
MSFKKQAAEVSFERTAAEQNTARAFLARPKAANKRHYRIRYNDKESPSDPGNWIKGSFDTEADCQDWIKVNGIPCWNYHIHFNPN